MNTLEDISQRLKTLVASIPPPVLVALALAVPLAVAGVLWLKARAAQRKQQRAAQPPPAPAPAPAPARTDRLLRVWKEFLQQLPPLIRRSIFQFQPFLVLGKAGSGKSQLIDTCTDWKQQEQQMVGASLDRPDLRICLGSRLLLLELPAALLEDTSRSGRETLLRLWKPLFRRRPPVVVVTLDAAALATTPVDEMGKQANRVRGKLNLLMEVCGKPPELRLVLTRLDQVKGYEAFARFMARQHLPATLSLSQEDWKSEAHLESALRRHVEGFEHLLPRALTRAPATDYLQMVAFLEKLPPYLLHVAHYLAVLGAHTPPLLPPRPERLYLAALHEGAEGGGANPFLQAASDARSTRVPDPRWRHRLAAVACVSLGALYLLTGYLHERTLWLPARAAALAYKVGPESFDENTNDGEPALRQSIIRFLERRKYAPMRYLPRFFSSQDEALEQRLSEGLRQRYILPKLQQVMNSTAEQQPHRRSLYLLAVLYATRDNALGIRIQQQKRHWAEATALDDEFLSTYVQNTTRPYEGQPPLASLHALVVKDPADNARTWQAFIQKLNTVITQNAPLTPEQLAPLKNEAGQLLKALEVIQRFSETPDLLDKLKATTGHDLSREYAHADAALKAPDLFKNSSDMKRLLQLVREGAQDGTTSEARLLSELNARLEALLDDSPQEAQGNTSLVVQVPGEKDPFTFEPRRWKSLIRQSSAHELVQRFLSLSGQRDSIFFSGDEALTDLEMRPGDNGYVLFTGKAIIQGPYTREAFTKRVVDVLAKYAALDGKLSSQEDRIAMKHLLDGEVFRYAQKYQAQVDNYYGAFKVQARSKEELQLLLRQMLEPGSPFNELLRLVRDNTLMEVPASPLGLMLAPMQVVRDRYAPLHNLLADDQKLLAPYRSMLEQIRQSLTVATAPPEAAATPDAADETAPAPDTKTAATPDAETAATASPLHGLKDELSPVGLMTLAMMRPETKGDYDELLWAWLGKLKLDQQLAGPFVAPLNALRTVGREEIGSTVSRLWRQHLLVSLADVQYAFPFNPESQEDVTPQQLEALFHPKKGRFHQQVRQYIQPIAVRRGEDWRKLPFPLAIPREVFPTISNVERLSRTLWKDDGTPQPLQFSIASVPFKPSAPGMPLLSLVYLHTGADSLLNFNQQPAYRVIGMDWTRPRQARLSIELLDPVTGAKTYPPALLSDISPWCLLRLLRRATQNGTTWSWNVPLGPVQNGARKGPGVEVEFQLAEDPWRPFALRPSAEPSEATASPSLP